MERGDASSSFAALQEQLSALSIGHARARCDSKDKPKFSEREMHAVALRGLNVAQQCNSEVERMRHECVLLEARAKAQERLHREALAREADLRKQLEDTTRALREAERRNYALGVHIAQFGKASYESSS